VRSCEHCGRRLGSRSRQDRRFCDTSCRVAWHRARDRELEAADWLEQLAALLERAPAGALAALAGSRHARGA
jgi:hypothetical protein